MRADLLAAMLVGAFLSCGGGCPGGGGPGPPAVDTCDQPGAGPVAALELGAGEADGFEPLVDGAVVALIYGDQGGAMIPVRLRASGASAPACLQYEASVRDAAGVDIYSGAAAVNTYAEGGARVTETLYLVLWSYPDDGTSVTLRAAAGGAEVERQIRIGFAP